MPRMRAPYTGVIFDVAPANVAAHLSRGFVTLVPCEPSAEPEPVEVAEPESDPERGAPAPEATKPTMKSTVAEIEAYAAEHGVDLDGCTNKAQRLERIAGAEE